MVKFNKYYTSIDDLPMWNFDRINETSDLKYLFVGLKGQVNNKIVEAWKIINSEFVEAYGISKETKTYLDKLNRLVDLIDDVANKGQTYKTTLIDITQAEIDLLDEKMKEKPTVNKYAALSKLMGYMVDSRKITVRQFFDCTTLNQVA